MTHVPCGSGGNNKVVECTLQENADSVKNIFTTNFSKKKNGQEMYWEYAKSPTARGIEVDIQGGNSKTTW